jgi:lipopolysaccharide biosynthesis regulator YciM
MKQRIRKIDRILKVQQHLQREAELKLANLEREANGLKAAQETIIQTMNDHETLHGLFVDVAAKRLQTLASQASAVEKAKVVQKSVALDRAMQAKRVEKMLSGLKDQERRETEKKDLASILEILSKGKSASFP